MPSSPVPENNVRVAFDRLPRTSHEEQVFDQLKTLVKNNSFIKKLNPLINDVHHICSSHYEVVFKLDDPELREIRIHEPRTIDQSTRVAVIRLRFTPST